MLRYDCGRGGVGRRVRYVRLIFGVSSLTLVSQRINGFLLED